MLNTALKVMSRSLRLGNKDAQSSTGMKQVFLGHAANSHQQELGIKSMSLAEVFLACITCPDRQEVCKMPAGAKLSLSLHCCLVTHKICCAALRCAVHHIKCCKAKLCGTTTCDHAILHPQCCAALQTCCESIYSCLQNTKHSMHSCHSRTAKAADMLGTNGMRWGIPVQQG